MAARQIIVPGAMPSRDRNGRVMPGKLRFYEPGTAFSTPAIVYSDSDLTTPHDFPILSDGGGKWPAMWADEAEVFDAAWTDQVNDAPHGQWTDLSPAEDAVLASVDDALGAAERAEAAALRAEAAAASVTGEPFAFTSSSSNTATTGAKVFEADQEGTFFYEGQYVTASVRDASENQVFGRVDAVETDSGGIQTITIDATSASAPGGVGPYTSWQIALASAGGVTSLAGQTGSVTAAQARTAMDVFSTSEARAFAIAAAVSL
jgi:hypothetical protein